MNSRWLINKKGLENYVIGEDKNIYKRPSVSIDGRHYHFKLVKEQYPNRFRLNRVYWSKNQLKHLLIKDKDPVEIYKDDSDVPF